MRLVSVIVLSSCVGLAACVESRNSHVPLQRAQLEQSAVLAAVSDRAAAKPVVTHGTGGGPASSSSIVARRDQVARRSFTSTDVLVDLVESANRRPGVLRWNQLSCAGDIIRLSGAESIDGVTVGVAFDINPSAPRTVTAEAQVGDSSVTGVSIPVQSLAVVGNCTSPFVDRVRAAIGK